MKVFRIGITVFLSALLVIAPLAALFAGGRGESGGEDESYALRREYPSGEGLLVLEIGSPSVSTSRTLPLRLSLLLSETRQVVFPGEEGNFGDFSVASAGEEYPKLLEGGSVLYSATYILKPFLPGTYTRPPLPVLLDEGSVTLTTGTETIEVFSELEEGEGVPDIRGIRRPDLGRRMPALLWIGLAAAAAAAAYLFYRWRKRVPKEEPLPPPRRIAELELENLLLRYERDRDGRALYAGLCDMLRTFIESEFSIRAPEQTTEEFLIDLSGSDDIGPEYKKILKDFVSTGDLVKFAGYLPLEEEIARAVETSRAFLMAGGRSRERNLNSNDEGT